MNIAEHSLTSTGFEQEDLVVLIPHMRAFARSLCHDRTQADDLTQDALASALRCRNSFTTGTNLKSWLFTIVRNQFYTDKRRSWRSTQLDPGVAEETLVAVTNPQAALELEDVRAAMLQLCDEQREALILVAIAGLPYDEAAAICDCPEGTIKSRVNRARLKLLAILSQAQPLVRPPRLGGAMAALVWDAQRLCAPIAA